MHSTLKGFWIQEDESGSARHSPGCSARNCQSPIATRTRRNGGRPTAAVMRRTWRLRPSASTSSSPASDTAFRKRTERKSDVLGTRAGVRVELGGARLLKKKN